jgi:hypothetical protein
MRTQRTFLVGLATLALVGCASVAAFAQESTSPEAIQNAQGSIWLERHETGPDTFYVLHGDGLMTGFNRQLGIGVGQWAPVDEDSVVAHLGFTGTDGQYSRLEPGTADLRFSGQLDDAGDLMTLTYEQNDLGMTSASVERQKMAPMPPEAASVTPPDTGWHPVIGIAQHQPDESGVTLEQYGGRPNMNLEHSDGTWVSINSWVGPGVGLTAAPDEYHAIVTAWFTNDDPDHTLPLVAEVSVDPETGETTNAYGTSEGFTDSAPGEPQELDSDSGALPEPDPSWWPSLGSLWVEEHDDGPDVTTAFHADGTLLTIDPYRGVGVGSWQPTGPDTAALTIDYYDTDPSLESVKRGPATLRGELRTDETGEVATIDFTVENRLEYGLETWEEPGSATLHRQPFEG